MLKNSRIVRDIANSDPFALINDTGKTNVCPDHFEWYHRINCAEVSFNKISTVVQVFQKPTQYNFDAVLMVIHTDPDEATEEINALDDVLTYAQSVYTEENRALLTKHS
jgi:hypothetical protein